MKNTTNFEKHTNQNPISKFFLENFSKVLIESIQPLKPQSILDVGAGEGFVLEKLRKNKIGKKLEGIEYMDEAIALGKKTNPLVKIRKGDIYKLPYKDNAFELIICTEVMEHLEDPKAALAELKRVTSKHIILSVPNEPLFTIQRFLRGKNMMKLGDHPEHIQHWNSGTFRAFVADQLTIKEVKTPLPWTMVIAKK
ncbi:MAG: class I SAM-dependent methyltransferase [Candidatus Levybacteria bacterium]|nr:class I SAM-dependent methyltransferase [Candidatus Levybacteria bacterium]